MHNTAEMKMCYEVGVWGYLITSPMSYLKGDPAMPGGAGSSQGTNKPPQEAAYLNLELLCLLWSSSSLPATVDLDMW